MAKPQLENGYIKIANELYDAIAKNGFNGTQRAIIDAVLRYTYGYNRSQSKISISLISDYTGKDRINVSKELNKLIDRKIIDVVSSAEQRVRVLKINKNYDEWIMTDTPTVVEIHNSCRDTQQLSECTTQLLSNHTTNCCRNGQHNKYNYKYNINTSTTKSKNPIDEDVKNAVKLYEQNIGVPSPIAIDVLRDIISSHSADLLELAISEAVKANAKNIKYIEAIFRNWDNAGVKTVDSAKLAIAEHQQKKLSAVSAKKEIKEPAGWGHTKI